MLGADKTLVGDASWRSLYGDANKLRWRKPCVINGELTGMEIEVQAYPSEIDLKFRIILVYQKAIWRLDFARNEAHLNSANRPTYLPLGPIDEPHYHSWIDNRRFSTRNSLPSDLPNANNLPIETRSFDAAFRWFCGETRITVASLDMPQLPPRARLI